jgi:hypothetical protein
MLHFIRMVMIEFPRFLAHIAADWKKFPAWTRCMFGCGGGCLVIGMLGGIYFLAFARILLDYIFSH